MSLAKRTVVSVMWKGASNLVMIAALFVRSVLLARLLPVEVFGIYGLASAMVALAGVITEFGLREAFLHRSPETKEEDKAAAIHFTLNALITLVWATLLIILALVSTEGKTRTAVLWLTLGGFVSRLCLTPRLILTRRVVHRRLALLDLVDVLLSTLIALILAWRGITLGALLAIDLTTSVLSLFFLYLWRPVWTPHLAWSTSVVKYFLHFGSQAFLIRILGRTLDRVDDLWVGRYLGQEPLGFYSKAYAFARYPRRVLAVPIYQVSEGTLAELKNNRPALSRSFFRTNAFLVRVGFFIAGLFALVGPEFIRIVLTQKWLPILGAFRVMLIFTMLEQVRATVVQLFVAVGYPNQAIWARLAQLVALGLGLILLGPTLGIVGVAIAVDIMELLGIALLFWQAKRHVDFSIIRLFAVPTLATAIALLAGRIAIALPGVMGSDWRTGFVKSAVFVAVYGAIALALERNQFLDALRILTSILNKET